MKMLSLYKLRVQRIHGNVMDEAQAINRRDLALPAGGGSNFEPILLEPVFLGDHSAHQVETRWCAVPENDLLLFPAHLDQILIYDDWNRQSPFLHVAL